MSEGYIAWDIGGVHIKSAYLNAKGVFEWMTKVNCPLWKGINELEQSLEEIANKFNIHSETTRHVVTMTGELADNFANRDDGVDQISDKVCKYLGTNIWLYGSKIGFIDCASVNMHRKAIASANWYASAAFLAEQTEQGILIDVGSTTTDIIPFRQGQVIASGVNDQQRLMHGELVYTGITRTPVMAIDDRFDLNGKEQGITAEMFATTADVYRILELLPEYIDLYPTCDGRSKSKIASAVRLARMFGCDYNDDFEVWLSSAKHIALRQQEKITQAIETVAKANDYADDVALISAGAGHFIVPDIASRIARAYHPFAMFVSQLPTQYKDQATEYATVLSLACLAQKNVF